MLSAIFHLFIHFVFTEAGNLVNILYFSVVSFSVLAVLGVHIIALAVTLTGLFVTAAVVTGTSVDAGVYIYSSPGSCSPSFRTSLFRFAAGTTTTKYFEVKIFVYYAC
jgi:hypothetical protein